MDLSLEKRFAKRRLQMTDFLPSTTISPPLSTSRSLARSLFLSLSLPPLSKRLLPIFAFHISDCLEPAGIEWQASRKMTDLDKIKIVLDVSDAALLERRRLLIFVEVMVLFAIEPVYPPLYVWKLLYSLHYRGKR